MNNSGTVNDTMLEIAVNAAAAGHDLSGFESVDKVDGNSSGYQARCRNCSQTAWVAFSGLTYSLLDSTCNGRK